jgi:hypothetical protein
MAVNSRAAAAASQNFFIERLHTIVSLPRADLGSREAEPAMNNFGSGALERTPPLAQAQAVTSNRR